VVNFLHVCGHELPRSMSRRLEFIAELYFWGPGGRLLADRDRVLICQLQDPVGGHLSLDPLPSSASMPVIYRRVCKAVRMRRTLVPEWLVLTRTSSVTNRVGERICPARNTALRQRNGICVRVGFGSREHRPRAKKNPTYGVLE
jgi:hypothetical protein